MYLSGQKPSGFLGGKLQNHSALTETRVYARPHFGIVRLPVRDTAQKNTWVCLQSHHKTARARLVKNTGWKTVEIGMPLGLREVQEGAERHLYTPGIRNPDSDGFMNHFQACRLVSFGTQRTLLSAFFLACTSFFAIRIVTMMKMKC